MNAKEDTPGDEKSADEAAGPVCGERLAEARRAQQMTAIEVAKELHIDEPKVRALECNDFAALGAPVFAKGHLRKYAQLVGVDEDDVFSDYYHLTRSMGMPPIVGGRISARKEPRPGPWIAAIAVILAAAAAYWMLASRDPESAPSPALREQPPPAPARSETPAGAEDAAGEDTAVLAVALPRDETPATEPPPTESNVVAGADDSATAPALAAGELRVSLTFSGDCWTEIRDADGRRLFFGMGRNGRNAEFTGRAPLSALFGNAGNVSVRVNGGDYAVSPTDPDNRTARLKILSR